MFRAIHPGSPSRQKMTESAILGLKRAKETVVGCFWEEGLSLLSHFCSFSCMDAMNDSYSAMQWPAAGLLHRRGGGSLFGIYKYTGEKDENNAGNQNQYSAPFSPGEIKEFFKGVLHDGLFQKTQFIDKNQCNSYRSNIFQDEYQ